MAHYRFSPSASTRWMACPACLRLSDGIADKTSPHAEEGTQAHAVAAALLTETPVPACPEEMREYAAGYADFVRDLADADAITTVEQEIISTTLKNFGGTIDAMVLNRKRRQLCIVDFKYGRGVSVHAEGNTQLLCYAALAAETVDYSQIRLVRVYIYQPRAMDGNAIRCAEYTPQEIMLWKSGQLVPAMAAAEVEAPDARPGDWCRWCKAFPLNCEGIRAQVQDRALIALKEAGPVTPPPAVDALTQEQFARAVEAAELLEAWVKAVKAEALLRLKAGSVVRGWKLVRTAPHRRWKDDAAVKVCEILGDAAWEPKSLVSPAAAEKLAKGKEAKDAIRECAFKPTGELTMAEEGDRRPAELPSQMATDALVRDDDYLL